MSRTTESSALFAGTGSEINKKKLAKISSRTVPNLEKKRRAKVPQNDETTTGNSNNDHKQTDDYVLSKLFKSKKVLYKFFSKLHFKFVN